MKPFRRKGKKAEATKVVRIEPPVEESDIRSFFAKFDANERNVPVAIIAEWKQMAVEKMENVKSAEEFAFEQGRLSAYCELERAFLEMAQEFAAAAETVADSGEEDDEDGDA